MASFYGNMKNNSRASFIFDKIYPTRTAMEAALNAVDNDNNPIGDGIFVNRYVLVDYHYALADPIVTQDNIDKYYIEVDDSIITTQNFHAYYIRLEENNYVTYIHPTSFAKGTDIKYYQKRVFLDKYETQNILYTDRFESNTSISNTENISTTNELQETDLYYSHRYLDWENYKACYDSTVWMKIYVDGRERYIMVAELDAKAPVLEFVDDAPSCINGSGHFDARVSTDLNYVYFIPRNWDLILNQYDPNDSIQRTNNDNTYFYYQDEQESNPLWYENYIYTNDEVAQLGKSYYTITFNIDNNIKVGQSIKNLHCYIPKYEPVSSEELNSLLGNPIEEDYYLYSDGKYVLTSDSNFQAKQYYRLIDQQYMAADENVALKGVQYYRITSIIPIQDLIVGQSSVVGYYEVNNQKKTFNDNVQYPYFNTEGFNPKVSTHVSTKGQGVFLKKVQSTETYPVHVFAHAGVLTADTYLPNRYFTYHGPKAKVEDGHVYNKNYAYYIGASTNATSYELITLIYNKNGVYTPAKALDEQQSYYYDQDLTNKNYFTKSIEWHPGIAYYEITTAIGENGTKLSEHDEDTYRVDVYLPELGNTVADIYDVIYGAPIIQSDKTDGYNNLIGYCSKEQWFSYNIIGWCTEEQKTNFGPNDSLGNYSTASNYRFNLTEEELETLNPEKDEENGFIYPVYLMDGLGDYWASNKIFSLTDEQFNELSPEIMPGIYDIPVYLKEGSNVRPYTNERIKSTLITPYDNLAGENDISLGWSMTLLKRYLSELRQLAYGKDNEGHQIGLQSDWTQENDELIGYVQHRPVLITNFTKTADTVALPNKQYYREYVKNGEVRYESLSEHYDLLDSTDYKNLDYYYINRKNIMAKINNENQTVVNTEPLYVIEQIADQTSVDSTNYLNNDIWIKQNNNTYEKAINYSNLQTYYKSRLLEPSDYSQWYYQRDVINYIKITPDNYTNAIGKTIYKDDNGTEWTNNDFIHVSGGKYYYVDWNNDNVFDPDEYITSANVNNIGDNVVYEQIDGQYQPVRYYDYYYAVAGFAYDPINSTNYEAEKQMWKKNNNETYSQVTSADYIVNNNDRYFYQTESISYDLINEENFAREREKYKKVNNEYINFNFSQFIDEITVTDSQGEHNVPKYYILKIINGQTTYEGITSENANELSGYDIYERFQGEVIVGEELTSLGYTPYELPRTSSNNIEKNKDMYIRCTDYSTFDESTQYYIWDGSRYTEAVYTEYNYYIEPIVASNEKNGQVQYNHGYQVTVGKNTNNDIVITERKYSNCLAKTLFDSSKQVNHNIALYRHVNDNGTWKGKSVKDFSIIITNEDNPENDAPEISASILNLNNLTQTEVLNYLNTYLVNNYGNYCSIVVDNSYYNTIWPEEETNIQNTNFYYVSLGMDYVNLELDLDHFNANKTRYFTVEKVPIEQEDYEIHNIWNTVLERVLLEP